MRDIGLGHSNACPNLAHLLAKCPQDSILLGVAWHDWEATDAAGYNSQLQVHPYSKCITCPTDLANPELGKSFVGIERYLPTSLIEGAIDAADLGVASANEGSTYIVSRAVLETAKPKLAAMVQGGAAVGEYMQALARWIDDQVAAALANVPADAFI